MLRGELITMFQCLKGGYEEDGDFLFPRCHMEEMRDSGCKLLLGRFQLDWEGEFSGIGHYLEQSAGPYSLGHALPRKVGTR